MRGPTSRTRLSTPACAPEHPRHRLHRRDRRGPPRHAAASGTSAASGCLRRPHREKVAAMEASFSQGTASSIARARQHAIGDLLHRTARRHPDKLAVVAGDVRATYAEFDAAVNRCAHALSARGLQQGDRLALLSHNCWQFAVLDVRHRQARHRARAGQLHARAGRDRVHPPALRRVRDRREDALAPIAEKALAAAGIDDGVRGWIGLSGASPTAAGRTSRRGGAQGDASAPDVLVADDDPLRLMYTSGTESRPKGAMLSSRSLITQYVSCIVDGGMSRRRRRGPRAADVPLRAAALLLRPSTSTSARPASSCPAPIPPPCSRRSSGSGSPSSSARRRCGSRCCATPTSTRRDLSSCARGTTARRRCRSRCCASCSAGCRTCGCGTSTARRRWPRWPRSCARTSRSSTPVGRPGGAQRGDPARRRRRNARSPPGEVGEIVHRSPHATLGY